MSFSLFPHWTLPSNLFWIPDVIRWWFFGTGGDFSCKRSTSGGSSWGGGSAIGSGGWWCAPLCSSAGDDTPALAAPGAPSTQTSKSSWPAAPLTTLPHRTALQQSAAWVCRLLGRSAEQCAQLTRTSHERPPRCRLQGNCTNWSFPPSAALKIWFDAHNEDCEHC